MKNDRVLTHGDGLPMASSGSRELRAPATKPLQEALMALRSAQQVLIGEPPSPEALTRASRDLGLAQEELAAQLAEIETAARARQQERALTQQLVEGLPVAVVTTSRVGAVLEANPAAEDLLRVPSNRLERHKPLFAFVRAEDRRRARDLLGAASAGPSEAQATLTFTPRQGEPVTCRVTVLPWPDDQGHEPGSLQWVVQPEQTVGTGAYQRALVELTRLGAGDADLSTLLRQVAELVVGVSGAARAASVVLGDPAEPTTVVSTSPLAQTVDGLQYMSGSGPLFDAYTRGEPVLATDPLNDPRWPELHRVTGNGPGTWLALPLPVEERPAGVLMVYGDSGGPGVEELRPFADAAATLVRDSRTMQEIRQVQDQLREALASRAVIDQAKGMIMFTRRCSADEAFALLVRMSNDSNRKIRDLAAEFVQEATEGSTPMH